MAEEVAAAEAAAFNRPGPGSEPASPRPRLPVEMTHPSSERRGDGPAELTMKDALREVLRSRIWPSDSRVVLYGQDIEDPKGDVFGVTQGAEH